MSDAATTVPTFRFEVSEHKVLTAIPPHEEIIWSWTLIGADGPVCISAQSFDTERAARSHIAANKGRFKAAGRARVITKALDA